MGYTTFEFYRDSYYGDSIEESLFPKWEDRATTKLDQLTYGNITEESLQDTMSRFRKPPVHLRTCYIRLILRPAMLLTKKAATLSLCPLVDDQSVLEAMRHLLIRCLGIR